MTTISHPHPGAVSEGGSGFTVERGLRLAAGFFVLLSLLLAVYVSPLWLWFTAFVGANLFQSAFTNWCPMMYFLRRLGLRD